MPQRDLRDLGAGGVAGCLGLKRRLGCLGDDLLKANNKGLNKIG